MLPFVESAAEVLNARVTATLALAATRSPAAMRNVTAVADGCAAAVAGSVATGAAEDTPAVVGAAVVGVVLVVCWSLKLGNCIADSTASVEVVIRRPPKVLAIVKIVKPEQVTVIDPIATDADVVMIMFPLRMSDVEAVPSEGLETSHVPVLPMNGK